MIIKVTYNKGKLSREYYAKLDVRIRKALESNAFTSHEQYTSPSGLRIISFKLKED